MNKGKRVNDKTKHNILEEKWPPTTIEKERPEKYTKNIRKEKIKVQEMP